MPEGAMKSAPERACDKATRPRFSSVASLSTSPLVTTPQCPCEVYSSKQASSMTTMSGNFFLMARVACWTRPSSFHASEPTASFLSGTPNRISEGMPSSAAFCASATHSSTESCACPGIDAMGLRVAFPGMTNSGSMKSSARRCVSRTIFRRFSVRRTRRGRYSGNCMPGGYSIL
jgi:hypothetical protein